MTKLEEYTAKAADSAAAAEAAKTDAERAFHRRANGIWRRLIANVGEAEQRALLRTPAVKPAGKNKGPQLPGRKA